MANDDLKKRLAALKAGKRDLGLLLEKPEPGKIGMSAQRLITGKADPDYTSIKCTLEAAAQRRSETPMEVYFVFDTTGSMRYVIEAVQKVIGYVGHQILQAEKGIAARVIGVGDHCDLSGILKGIRTPAKLLGDYGQINDPTTDPRILESQVKRIVYTHGGDDPEAYECLAHDLVALINEDKSSFPEKKHAVVLFGDAYAQQNRIMGVEDGCPNQRDAKQLIPLVSTSTRTFFVGCGGHFEELTYGIVRDLQKAQYVPFNQSRDVLPEALIGMVKLARHGAEGLQTYVTSLPKDTATKIMGLLSPGKGIEKT